MNFEKGLAKLDAPGRLALGKPVAIVDIGSNSVRLVAYEGLSRSPTPIFNDKLLCGRVVKTDRRHAECGLVAVELACRGRDAAAFAARTWTASTWAT